MGLENLITQVCVQTAVYWGTPVDDGYGGKTFTDPVELQCRWENKAQKIINTNGEETISRAWVLLLEDVVELGWLFLGDLDDLDSAEEADPMSADGAYEIQRFEKTPAIRSTTQFTRVAYL